MSLLLVCSLSVALASAALAAAGDQYQQQAAQLEKMLEKHAGADGADAAQKDIEQARKWLDNAKVLLAKGNEEAASRYLRRVKISLELIDELVQVGTIQKAADEQEEAYYKAKEKKIPELEAEIQELQDQKKELQSELSELR